MRVDNRVIILDGLDLRRAFARKGSLHLGVQPQSFILRRALGVSHAKAVKWLEYLEERERAFARFARARSAALV